MRGLKNTKKQNIFFTLLIGVIGIDLIKRNKKFLIKVFIVLTSLIIAYFLKVDYSWYGVSVIFIFYFLRKLDVLKLLYIQILSFISVFSISVIQVFAFLGFVPILMYNGKLGRKTGDIYYSFYALHLFIFYCISNTFKV